MRFAERLLASAPAAVPVCSTIAAMVSITDLSDRPPRALADGESSRWAATRSSGSTRRMCRMAGTAGC